MATKLTEAAIKRLPAAPAGKRLERPDALAPGLVLRINDAGRKDWIARYRVGGKQAKQALGTWPAMGLAEAREKAREVREQAAAGVDPKAAKEAAQRAAQAAAEAEARQLKTFADLAADYVARECPRLVDGREYESLLRREVLPRIGGIALADLRRRDAVRVLDAIADSGRPGVAQKTKALLLRISNWAQARDEVEVSPFAGLKSPVRIEPRDRTLAHGEIRTLWTAWARQGWPFGDMAKILLLTGCRLSEVAEMRRDELDDADEPTVWTIPGSRTKNGQPHVLPLPPAVREILAGLPRFTGPYVFSTTGGQRPVSGFSRAKARADALAAELAEGGAEPVAGWRYHDLRRTCRTELARLGVSDEVAERVLNHKPGSLVQVYNQHRYVAEVGEALDRWATELLRIVGEAEPVENVVPLAEVRA